MSRRRRRRRQGSCAWRTHARTHTQTATGAAGVANNERSHLCAWPTADANATDRCEKSPGQLCIGLDLNGFKSHKSQQGNDRERQQFGSGSQERSQLSATTAHLRHSSERASVSLMLLVALLLRWRCLQTRRQRSQIGSEVACGRSVSASVADSDSRRRLSGSHLDSHL